MADKDTMVVVGVTRMDGYGNMFVTPAGGGDEVKIGSKRAHLHDMFEQGRAIMLHWETYRNIPYVSDAKPVEGELPPSVKPVSPPLQPGEEPLVKEAVKLGARVVSVDNVKNRAVAISYSKDLVCASIIKIDQLRAYADKFLEYIENK